MKYAIIAMVAIYLLTAFGCNPDEAEKGSDSHSTPVHTSVDATGHAEEAPASDVAGHAEEAAQQPAIQHVTETEPAVAEQAVAPVETAQVETAPAQEGKWEEIADSTTATVLSIIQEDDSAPVEAVPAAEATEQVQPVVAEVQAEQLGEPIKVEVTETVVVEETQPLVPEVVEVAPEAAMVQEEPVVAAVPQEAAPEQYTTPCGKVITNKDLAKAPCLAAKQQAASEEKGDLDVAMQKMVEATNDMVMVTRQLVLATQQMLDASKNVATEVVETGKEPLEANKK